ncbi:polymer-forming cytoskeletal protein [Paracoccaceae bacterium]|nr:polymer-forming cytoskeletal protein [Paracoccaceae bacterium]
MIFNSWKKKKQAKLKKSVNVIEEKYNVERLNKDGAENLSLPSYLDKEIKIKGKVTSKGELQLDGVLEGELIASKLVIEKSAKVVGSVSSEDLVIKGRIIGPVFGKKVRFGASARVEGDTFHETIAIEDGAYYEGSIRRHQPKSSSELKKPE